jgi:hypothetical protein
VSSKTDREWIFVGSPLTLNALNDGHAIFSEYHNAYIEPCSHEKYLKTGVVPDGTIFYKELQLTLTSQNLDGSRTEPSGGGYFPGALNGADVTVKDSKRFAETGGWGYFDFIHFAPKLASTNALSATLPAQSATRSGHKSIVPLMKSRPQNNAALVFAPISSELLLT